MLNKLSLEQKSFVCKLCAMNTYKYKEHNYKRRILIEKRLINSKRKKNAQRDL